jgi:hypothetical protein
MPLAFSYPAIDLRSPTPNIDPAVATDALWPSFLRTTTIDPGLNTMHARNIRHSIARPIARVASLLSLATVVGCAAAASQPSPVDTSARALVYGHIEASKPIQAVRLAKIGSARHPWATVMPNGDFYFENVSPGRYGLMQFNAGNERYLLLTGDTTNNKRFIVDVAAGGMYYVGSWRVTGKKDNTFRPDEFTITRAGSPDAKALLARLKPALAGSGWEKRIGPATTAKKGR